jgi:hypothetical protein
MGFGFFGVVVGVLVNSAPVVGESMPFSLAMALFPSEKS